MQSERDDQHPDHPEKLVPMFVRLTPATHSALKEHSRLTAVPVSVLVRQVIAAWLDGRPPEFNRTA